MKNKDKTLYQEVISQLLIGNVNQSYMEEALEKANGDKSKAEALYVIRLCNEHIHFHSTKQSNQH